MTETLKCAHCEDPIDSENDEFYGSEHDGNTYCPTCYRQDLEYASTAILVGPDYPDPVRVFIGDWFIEADYGDPWNGPITFDRAYKSTGGWRGYYETRIDGWTEILSGWTTGGWGDSTSLRKQDFNEWAESLITQEQTSPVNVAIITDPTSNVFSTAVGVWVADKDVETLTQWLGETADELERSLA